MRRSLTSLPAGIEFAAATVAVTAVLLAVGLLVRPMMAREADPGQAVGLMHVRAEVPAGAAVTAKVTCIPAAAVAAWGPVRVMDGLS